MGESHSVQPYFDAKAPHYDRLSSRGLWSRVRFLESRALFRLLGPLIELDALDLGCGSGFYTERMRKKGARVFGVDSSPAMIRELTKKHIEGKCAGIPDLDLGRKFRVILAAGVVEFLADERSLFDVAKKHCAPGGRLVLLAPRSGLAGFAYEVWHSWKGCRAKARGVKELSDAALKAGWKLDRVRSAGPVALALRFVEVSRG
jgi:2-polyprenyl-3-methyl-5-hydroxy-6-metoxy-1,4-benzoquinol methylase